MSEGLGARLRQEREDRGISLAAIAAATKVSASLFAALERDDVSRWPPGIFRRSFVRAYAQAVGLDPDATLREFLEQFPEPADPAPSGPRDTIGESRRPHTGLRLTFADAPAPSAARRWFVQFATRCAAAAVDAAFLLSAALAVYVVFGDFWMALGSLAVCYSVGSTLFLGATPGACLFADAAAAIGSRRLRADWSTIVEQADSFDPVYDRGIGAIASVSDPLSSS